MIDSERKLQRWIKVYEVKNGLTADIGDALPDNTSHALQRLYIAVFSALQNQFRKVLGWWSVIV